jgi:outer membrane immunogenic protein
MSTMKTFLLGSAALAALVAASPANATDWLDAPPAYSKGPAVYDWTGLYAGVVAGGGWGVMPWASGPDATAGSTNIANGHFGGTLGYNAQTVSAFVLSTEADIAWNHINASVPGALAPTTCAPFAATNCELTSNWLATARLRLGYAFDRVMPYVTGGVSVGDLTAEIIGQPLGNQSVVNLSWTVGVGVEFVINGPWTAKVEYLHTDLSGITCGNACNGGPLSTNLSDNIVRVGLNYRLWGH